MTASVLTGLRLSHFSAGYSGKRIISDLTVPLLPRGKITVLLGPNGSGKSTLLRAMAGLNPSRGELWLDDTSLMDLHFSQRAEKVIYLPQTLPVGVHLHVLESIIVSQRASGGVYRDNKQVEVMALLRQLGIAHLALNYLDQLSGGQKQLVGLAQSLIRTPSLLLLDEPLSALDLNYQFHVMELIARETRRRNMVTIVVVHDINTALRHGDHILILKQGEMVANGVPEDVITEENLAAVYGVKARIEFCSHGYPYTIIDGLIEPASS
ncbi:ABC transporter ATP-binding protein [Salmonella enterica]|nr:ABC transporter ATP-binding protein [Salmonella enterica]